MAAFNACPVRLAGEEETLFSLFSVTGSLAGSGMRDVGAGGGIVGDGK